MDEAAFRRRCEEYVASLSLWSARKVFSWTARLLTPRVLHDGEIIRHCSGEVSARTWQEAAVLLALERLVLPPDRWFTDVILRRGDEVALAWEQRCWPTAVLHNEQLIRMDNPEPVNG